MTGRELTIVRHEEFLGSGILDGGILQRVKLIKRDAQGFAYIRKKVYIRAHASAFPVAYGVGGCGDGRDAFGCGSLFPSEQKEGLK